jgi:hypothetical protein
MHKGREDGMVITCQGCQSSFEFPKGSIPVGQKVFVLCTQCRSATQLTLSSHDMSPAGFPAALKDGRPRTSPGEVGDDRIPLEIVEEGVETALIMATHPEHLRKVEEALNRMNYYVSIATTAKTALTKLRHNDYHVFVLDETFDGGKQEKDILLQYIQMPNHARRHRFFCILTEEIQTLDDAAAFTYCANMVLNVGDLDHCETILRRSVTEYKSLYKVFWKEFNALQRV